MDCLVVSQPASFGAVPATIASLFKLLVDVFSSHHHTNGSSFESVDHRSYSGYCADWFVRLDAFPSVSRLALERRSPECRDIGIL